MIEKTHEHTNTRTHPKKNDLTALTNYTDALLLVPTTIDNYTDSHQDYEETFYMSKKPYFLLMIE